MKIGGLITPKTETIRVKNGNKIIVLKLEKKAAGVESDSNLQDK